MHENKNQLFKIVKRLMETIKSKEPFFKQYVKNVLGVIQG
ncbi:hypothetical protein ADIARSV_0830 [Arcticibacter svalbardensis MN12-7]|uniref:Uncharacterized protein n=1 Tax=Arcticibacter svalbardensis MN12-7 TaxID=1150600 RepID=R9H4A6_9SPHI|nr:hypothetical protein ADIARSV_0830 [Arcticibacter svalbardensis MN12-7]